MRDILVSCIIVLLVIQAVLYLIWIVVSLWYKITNRY
jgi:hypothetical protein